VRVWLDDDLVDRAAPEGWRHVTTAWDAIELLESGEVVELSLDHDLGDDERFGRGIDVVDRLVVLHVVHGRDLWPRDGISLHTANPVGRENMARAIRAGCRRCGIRFAETRPGGQPHFEFER
jgi:hypothetical protein